VPVLVTHDTATSAPARNSTAMAIRYAPDVVVGTSLNGAEVPMRVVARTRALPWVGRVGAVADLGTALDEYAPLFGQVVDVQLWTAPGTTPAMLGAVRDAGVSLSPALNLAQRHRELHTDAFSMGMRLFLIVGLATLLLAVFGVFASAVLQSRWRAYEVAALRVVGVRRRSLVRASVLEYVVMLGVAAALGVLSTLVSVWLVLPSISLGPADEFDPTPVYDVPWAVVGAVGLGVFAVATVIALLVSRRIARLGRPATLRWAEQG
jgi:putative ABC transport system permease protein